MGRLKTPDEVAEKLQITRSKLMEYARCGLIHSVRIGRDVRFKKSAIKNYIKKGGSLCPSGQGETGFRLTSATGRNGIGHSSKGRKNKPDSSSLSYMPASEMNTKE